MYIYLWTEVITRWTWTKAIDRDGKKRNRRREKVKVPRRRRPRRPQGWANPRGLGPPMTPRPLRRLRGGGRPGDGGGSHPGAATRPPSQPHPRLIVATVGSKEWLEVRERGKQQMLKQAEELENMADDVPGLSEEDLAAWRAYKAKFSGYMRWMATDEVTIRPTPPPSDTQEEQLSAEYMEELAGREICPQARHFATLALKHYNSKRTHKFEMATVLLSKCFAEVDGQTFAHVNFTAAPEGQSNSITGKRLFFAELMLIPELQVDETAEPMRVLNVCTIDDSCYGGCHLIRRDIKNTLRNKMDYERCHACSHRIKHPKGDQFIAGHNSTRMPYYSAFPAMSCVQPLN